MQEIGKGKVESWQRKQSIDTPIRRKGALVPIIKAMPGERGGRNREK